MSLYRRILPPILIGILGAAINLLTMWERINAPGYDLFMLLSTPGTVRSSIVIVGIEELEDGRLDY